jgi:translation initiation factor 3 subunit E
MVNFNPAIPKVSCAASSYFDSHNNKFASMADKAPTSATAMLNGASAQAGRTPEEIAKEYDLLPKLLPHLDRHLIFPLLQFVADQEEEPSAETTKAKYELLKKTNMTDYVASLYCELEGLAEAPAQFAAKRQEVLDQLEKYEQESAKITDLLSREDVITNLRSDKVANLEYLKKEHEVCSKGG